MNYPIIKSHLAGSWYASDAAELRREIEKCIIENPVKVDNEVNCVILPHAGYAYSLRAAARTLSKVDRTRFKRAVIIAPAHRVYTSQISIEPCAGVVTPFGQIDTDLELLEKIAALPEVAINSGVHRDEHATQIQLPLLQYFFGGDFEVVSLVCGDLSRNELAGFALKLRDLIADDTLLVISSDFTHFGTSFRFVPFLDNVPARLKQLDFMVFDCIKNNDFDGLLQKVEQSGVTVCGYKPIAIMLAMLPEQIKVDLVEYYTSGDLQGNYKNSVSYLGAAVAGNFRSAPKAELTAGLDSISQSGLLSDATGAKLLKLARAVIAYGLANGRRPGALKNLDLSWKNEVPAEFSAVRGGFVTLHEHGRLRGCIGEIIPRRSIEKVVLEQAINAAFADNRFRPVSREEFNDLVIEISVLTPPETISSYQEIELGRHGILLNCQGRSSVFLPQVAPEQGWDLPETLNNLALKAGLPASAWRGDDASFQVFEAQIFHE
ncbi:MAG: AmmeMemoRadiSam system protein B [Victivallaceae bacterium]